VVRVIGANSGPLEFFGRGAGGEATASSVVGDIMSAIERRACGLVPRRGVVGEAHTVAPLRLPFVVRRAGDVELTEPRALDDAPACGIPLLV
jgi:hypothetical protein